jgi:hypothetical protein
MTAMHAALAQSKAEGKREAYAEVVRQGMAVYNDERNDISDRRAIHAFIERFEHLARK